MIREVITYPNKLLRLKSKDVEQFDNKLHTLLDDMYETMMAQSGVGLAAIQVAIPLNVLIINLPNEDDIQDKNDLIEGSVKQGYEVLDQYEQTVIDPYFEDENVRNERYTAIEAFRSGKSTAAEAAKQYVEKQQSALDKYYKE